MSPDLAYTLVASFGMFFMGIIVYFHDRSSVTNRLFFLMSLSTVFWSLANYFSLTSGTTELVYWVRLVLFFAAPHAVLFLIFIYNFPNSKLVLNKKIFWTVVAVLFLTMWATMSPYVFTKVDIIQNQAVPTTGPLMPLFGLVVLGSLVLAISLIIKKYIEAKEVERVRWKYMLVGVSLSYILLIITNFVFVVFWSDTYFVKFGPLFMLPAVFGMGYAILKHRLLNVKAITTEILTFAILSVSLFEVLTASNFWQLLFKIGAFSLLFLFGVFLIKSVLKEVEQREKLEVLTKELVSANEKLKELDHLKSQFLSFASHQIKTPLAAIKGFASLICDGSYGECPPGVNETSRKIGEAANRMISLVNEFLDLRKIEEGKMSYTFTKIDGVKMVANIIDELKPLAQAKKLDLSFESEVSPGQINADEQRIRQVFQNLIENAIKYTDSGFVKVGVKSENNSFVFSVSDSGHGLEKELLPGLFEEFRRAGSSDTKRIEGTGLGLFIAKQIVVGHKGEIWAESEGPGKGSKFFVKLPLVD